MGVAVLRVSAADRTPLLTDIMEVIPMGVIARELSRTASLPFRRPILVAYVGVSESFGPVQRQAITCLRSSRSFLVKNRVAKSFHLMRGFDLRTFVCLRWISST